MQDNSSILPESEALDMVEPEVSTPVTSIHTVLNPDADPPASREAPADPPQIADIPEAQNQAPQASPTPESDEARIRSLAQQTYWLKEHSGIDMLRVLRANPELSQKVADGNIDIYQAHATYAASLRGGRGEIAPSVVRGGSGQSAAIDIDRLSGKDFRAIEERLAKGEAISLE